LYGRCDEDATRPYQPVAEALSGMLHDMPDGVVETITRDVAPDLVLLLPELQRRFATRATSTTERFVLFDAAATVITRVAADRAVLIVLDDLHWADAPSLALVRHLLRTQSAAPVLVAGTYRDGDVDPNGPVVRWLVDVRREVPAVELALQGLDRDAVSVLLGPDGRHHLDEVWSVTDGNPFFVIELRANLSDAASRGVPQTVRQSVAERTRRLPAATWRFVHAAAIAGLEIDVAVASVAAQVAADDAIPAVTTGLLVESPADAGRLRFGHALVRDAALDGLTSLARADLHRRVATAIQELHADRLDEYAGRLAHHYREAGNTRADGPAYQWSMRAGRHAGQLLAYEEAEQHFAAAAEIADTSGDVARRVTAELELAEVLRRGGRPSAGHALAESAARAAHEIGASDLVAWAVFVTRFGQAVGMPGNLDAVQEAAAALAPDSVWRAPLDIVVSGELMQAGRVDDGIAILRDTAERARAVDDWAMLAFALTGLHIYVDRVDVSVDEILAAVARADDHWAPSFGLSPAVLRVQSEGFRIGELVAAGKVAQARTAVHAFATRYGDELGTVEANVLLFGITDALLAGDVLEWQRRLARFREDVELTKGFGAQLGMCELLAAWLQGRLGESAPLLERMPPTMMFVRPGLSLALAEGGRADEARAVLEECAAGDGIERRAHTVFGRFELSMLGYATTLLADTDVADRIYRALLPRRGQVAAWAAWAFWGSFDAVLGALALALGDVDAAIEHLDAALTLHDRAGWHALAARTASDLAHALIDRGTRDDRDRATTLVETTEPVAVELGLDHVHERLVAAASRLERATLPVTGAMRDRPAP
jgi:tetratricopeptide (TPR) repeat protein